MNITEAKEYIKANKDFLDGVAKYKNAPQKDNAIAINLINCWRAILKDIGSKVVVPECASCNGTHPLVDLWMYCENANWFNEAETIVKTKRKRI
jgi:hypothetical protein